MLRMMLWALFYTSIHPVLVLCNPSTGQFSKGAPKVDRTSKSYRLHFFQYVTRPDIVAPIWNITVYDKAALAPGYWFAATYEYVEQDDYDNRAWIGPLVYDQAGELVWSGAPTFGGYNVKDFKVSSVHGVDMLSGIFARQQYDVLLDSTYQLHKRVTVEPGDLINIHAFTTVDNGTRSLAMTMRQGAAPPEDWANFGRETCDVYADGFEERDLVTAELTFQWNAINHIHVNESFVKSYCPETWDFLHGNSIDKFPDGDYLLSGRHTDTVYKISGKDGSIVWRFGGKNNSFVFEGHFSGQHDAQVRSQNESHTIITLVDNASRPGQKPITNIQSRGMVIALRTDTQPMTAEVIQILNHPDGHLVPGRCNFQTLDNGNVFLAWWNHSTVSEFSPSGKLLLRAAWRPALNSYRTYKFEWKGYPSQPPDVHSELIGSRDSLEELQTIIHVSWNGATEVRTWIVYTTDANGNMQQHIATAQKHGFETRITYNGNATWVTVEGFDRLGRTLGQSPVVRTVRHGDGDRFSTPGGEEYGTSESVQTNLASLRRASGTIAGCGVLLFLLRLGYLLKLSRCRSLRLLLRK